MSLPFQNASHRKGLWIPHLIEDAFRPDIIGQGHRHIVPFPFTMLLLYSRQNCNEVLCWSGL
jgi:hypothetical protein